MKTKQVSPHQPEVFALIEELNQHNLSHYPPDYCHLDPPEVLAQDNCIMIGVYDEDVLLGIGAIKKFADYGEVKRMYVPPENRGKGVATLVLRELIAIAKRASLPFVRLETGEKFEAAMSLYKKHGFTVCEPFGQYKDELHCTCMGLALK